VATAPAGDGGTDVAGPSALYPSGDPGGGTVRGGLSGELDGGDGAWGCCRSDGGRGGGVCGCAGTWCSGLCVGGRGGAVFSGALRPDLQMIRMHQPISSTKPSAWTSAVQYRPMIL